MPDIEDTKHLSLGSSFVAYLDLLGQSALLRRLERLPRTDEERDDVMRTLSETALNVKKMRESFSWHFREGLLTEKSLSKDTQDAPRQVFSIVPRFRGFSDSVVITVPLRSTTETEHVAAVTAVHHALLAIAAVQVNFLANSTSAVRGGVDVGLGIDIYDGEYYGRALVEAYLLERDEAEYPRVLVGGGLTRYLNAVEQAAPLFAPNLAVLTGGTVRSCREMLLPDPEDNRLGIDPMVVAAFDDGSGSDKGLALCKAAVHRAHTSSETFLQQGDVKLAHRYARLRRLLESSPYLRP